jgi:hypothetical protein
MIALWKQQRHSVRCPGCERVIYGRDPSVPAKIQCRECKILFTLPLGDLNDLNNPNHHDHPENPNRSGSVGAAVGGAVGGAMRAVVRGVSAGVRQTVAQ